MNTLSDFGCRFPACPLPIDVEEVHQELDGAALEEHCEDNHGQPERKHYDRVDFRCQVAWLCLNSLFFAYLRSCYEHLLWRDYDGVDHLDERESNSASKPSVRHDKLLLQINLSNASTVCDEG